MKADKKKFRSHLQHYLRPRRKHFIPDIHENFEQN